jgi:hypothetical protein
MPTGTSATPSKSAETTPIEPKAVKPSKSAETTPIAPTELLLIFDPTQDPNISSTALVFVQLVEAALQGGAVQQVPEKMTIEPGLNKITPALWEVISSSPLAHVQAAIEKQALRMMEPWEMATLKERREIVSQCNNADLLPMMEEWLKTEDSAVVKGELEKRMVILQADRPDQYKSVRGMMANAT